MTEASTAPLRLGILGCAAIARPFVRDVAASPALRVVAAASRDADKAQAFCRDFGIARAHGSYEALLADPGVDAVYIPLPNTLHCEWAVKAAQAGKHVLCEKPLAVSLAEAHQMFAAARSHGVVLLEAYPWWFQPQTGQLVQLLAEGAIGRVMAVQASFGFALRGQPANIRLDPALGGGALLDAGSYTASLVRLAFGEAPVQAQAQASWTERGVDLHTTATLSFADGRRAQMLCAMDVAIHRSALILGSEGWIQTDFLNHTAEHGVPHPLGFQPSLMRLRRGLAGTVPVQTLDSPTGSGFRFEAEAFADVIARRDQAAVDRAAQASLDIAAMLEAVATSLRSGEPVPIDQLPWPPAA